MSKSTLQLLDALQADDDKRLESARHATEEALAHLRGQGDLMVVEKDGKTYFVFSTEHLVRFVKHASELINEQCLATREVAGANGQSDSSSSATN